MAGYSLKSYVDVSEIASQALDLLLEALKLKYKEKKAKGYVFCPTSNGMLKKIPMNMSFSSYDFKRHTLFRV